MILGHWSVAYCEDAGSCRPGDPVDASVQFVPVAVGVLAIWLLAWRAVRYARTGAPVEWRRPVLVFAVCAAGWLPLIELLGTRM